MTFLELAQTLREECGVSGAETTPTAVTGQTGEMRRLVNWIKRAYREVQNKRTNWDFLRFDFSFPTTAGVQTYTLAAVTPALTELARWNLAPGVIRCYLTATGTNDERDLQFVSWDEFRDVYLRSANRNLQQRPVIFTIKPDKSMVLWPKPDANYTIAGEYWKRAQALTANGDIPLIPEQFHDVMIGKGMMYYGADGAAPEVYAQGEDLYNEWMAKLETDQLPPMAMAGPLA